MCFLKTLKPLDEISFEKETITDDSADQETLMVPKGYYSFQNKHLKAPPTVIFTKQHHLLMNLMQLVNSNSIYLQNLDEKLSQNEQHLNNTHCELNQLVGESPKPDFSSQLSQITLGEHSHQDEETKVNPLISNLFGKKKYQYRLQPQGEIPTTIFKERNINITVNLVDQNNEKILNSNIIHLCLGVCDANGNWITENRVGEPFMKGKTQAEIYHGEGSFLKVYPRDVSRNYPEGKINFVVYSKPSMLKFSSNASLVEKIVDSDLIQPLLISDISIKAKKN